MNAKLSAGQKMTVLSITYTPTLIYPSLLYSSLLLFVPLYLPLSLISTPPLICILFMSMSLYSMAIIQVLSAQLLLDYMYFDGNTDKCKWDSDGITCYFCYCSILGCLVPCELFIPSNQ